MGIEKRVTERKHVEKLNVVDVTTLSDYQVIAHEAFILDASSGGFLLEISRSNFASEELKENISIDKVLGDRIALFMPQMNLDLNGTITRADHVGKGVYHVAVSFSHDVPEYWRQCLVDLMPEPGEFSEED